MEGDSVSVVDQGVEWIYVDGSAITYCDSKQFGEVIQGKIDEWLTKNGAARRIVSIGQSLTRLDKDMVKTGFPAALITIFHEKR